MKVISVVLAIICCVSSRSLTADDVQQRFLDLMTAEESNGVTTFAAESDVTYYLYTSASKDSPQVLAKALSVNLDHSKHTFVIIHGWVDSYTADVNRLVKTALLSKYDVNVIVVDWSPVAAESYTTAMGAVVSIGTFVADFLKNIALNPASTTLIGHSLGAHICGNAGAALNGQVSHIIGLDPAAPFFSAAVTDNRLDPTDGVFVQIIHTNGRFLGFATSIGHVDFYPNGGQIQAGCGLDLLGSCSHARAFQYLAEAIDGASFTATKCASYSDFQGSKCTSNEKVLMGHLDLNRSTRGDFFLDTNTAEPFFKG